MTIDETTVKHILEWRAHVGPEWTRDDASAFYDWSALTAGGTFTDIADTHTEADLEPAATSIALHSAAAFPSAGGLWFAGNAAGEAWEYCSYTGKSTNTLTGLTRETVDSEQTGHHTAGATARFWWELTTNNGNLTVSRQTDERLAAQTWTLTIAGSTIPQAALRLGHVVVIERREATGVAGDWGAWTIVQVGWVANVKAKDGSNAFGEWTVTVDGSNGLLAVLKAPGIAAGPQNDARGGSAQASTAMAAWYKEFSGGELPGSNPDLSPGAAIDGDTGTLYVSERHLGSANWPPGPDDSWAKYGIDQIHITKYPGQGRGYRWIQARVSSLGPLRLMSQDRYFPRLKDLHIPSPGDLLNGQWGTSIIVCENLAAFQAENPEIDGTFTVYEVPENETIYRHHEGDYDANNGQDVSTMTAAEWWDSLVPAGGALSLACGDQGYGVVIWGTETAAHLESNHGWTNVDWTGVSQLPPSNGQTLRRLWWNVRNTEAGWISDYISSPGYWIGQFNSKAYFCLERPPMGLTLTNTVTAIAPGAGDTLYISAGDSPSTGGLDASGTIQVGTEQITYSAKVSGGVTVTARGANSTTAAAHTAGKDPVQAVEDSLATDCWPLSSVNIIRPTGKPAIKNFTLYGSRSVVQPRLPGEEDWADDWDTLAAITNNTDVDWSYVHVESNKRYKFVLLQPTAMGSTPYRLMINEFRTVPHFDAYDTGTALASPCTVADVAGAILDGVGMPTGAKLVAAGGDDTPQVSGFTTAPDFALSVLSDLADMTGCFVKVEADSKVRTTAHPWFAGTPSVTRTWAKTTAVAFEPEWRSGRQVSQVLLSWVSLDGETTGTAKYPAVRDTFGDVVKVGPYVCTNQAAADVLAEKKYWLSRLPNGATVEAAGAPWDAEPGVAEGVSWQLDTSMLALARTYLLDGVDLRIERGGLAVVAHGAQYNREDEK